MTGPLEQVRAQVAQRQAQLARHGLALRAPPPEPTSCCGRGCNGCVWEGFYAAAAYWIEDADALLSPPPPPPSAPAAAPGTHPG